MPTRAAPRRPLPPTAASAASQHSRSQRLLSQCKTLWATEGCTRSGRGSWFCVSLRFCWYTSAGVRGGRLRTNGRSPRARDKDGDTQASGSIPLMDEIKSDVFYNIELYQLYLLKLATKSVLTCAILHAAARSHNLFHTPSNRLVVATRVPRSGARCYILYLVIYARR
jgi:hypothetical protein